MAKRYENRIPTPVCFFLSGVEPKQGRRSLGTRENRFGARRDSEAM